MTEKAEYFEHVVDRAYECFRHSNPIQSALIPILQYVQSEIGYIPRTALERVSDLLKLPTSHVFGVVTFYHQFRLKPKGEHMIITCGGTACHVRGSRDVHDFILRQLRITPPEDTSEDGLFSVHQVRCLGACGLAPVIVVDDNFYGKMNPTRIRQILLKHRKQQTKREDK